VVRDAFIAHLPVWIAMHEDSRSTQRMRIMFDARVEGMTAHARGAAE
jgi:hypothetical protein